MTDLRQKAAERLAKLRELAIAHKAWIRTGYDAVTPDSHCFALVIGNADDCEFLAMSIQALVQDYFSERKA